VTLRKLLFSKSFYGLLTVVLLLDMIADIAEQLHPLHHQVLNYISMLFDAIGLILVLWMLIDLSYRRPMNGDHPRRG